MADRRPNILVLASEVLISIAAGFYLEASFMSTILLIVLVLLLLGAIPTWPYSRGWGYYPSGGLGLVLVVVLLLVLLGHI